MVRPGTSFSRYGYSPTVALIGIFFSHHLGSGRVVNERFGGLGFPADGVAPEEGPFSRDVGVGGAVHLCWLGLSGLEN